MTYQTSGASVPASGAGREVFVLTDEQILGMEPEMVGAAGEERSFDSEPQKARLSAQDDNPERENATKGLKAPGWLAERMRDPWVGDEARELWEGAQKAQGESAAYREVFATPEEARELKQVYPGGVGEARTAAERARQMEEIDAVYFGAAGKAPEELRVGRAQLVEKLYSQDPGAFREMVELGRKILEGQRSEEVMRESATGQEKRTANAETQRTLSSEEKKDPRAQSLRDSGQAGVPFDTAQGKPVPQEVAAHYREFERAANAELERSVGGAIARSMEQALPNLRRVSAGGGEQGTGGLSARLTNAVREEIDAALRSDAQLGEQVSRILAGKKFDEGARAQVVRLIDARAQQLVPGAVRRVVGAWTEATVSGRKTEGKSAPRTGESAKAASARGRRVDYGKLSDEEILEL